jgi:hypothetical protein
VLIDTTYFESFAALIASVACGSRALPVFLTTYHREAPFSACFPPDSCLPDPDHPQAVTRPRWTPWPQAGALPRPFDSQNQIETHFIEILTRLVCPTLALVIVADRGFARAELFEWLLAGHLNFVVRIDASTHVWLPGAGASLPVADAMALEPGQRCFLGAVDYQQKARVPIYLLGLWDRDQEDPWYLASSRPSPDWIEMLYRWRMRLECTNRDLKTGVLLREGDDHHKLRSVLHLHRLLLALCVADWLCALTGLQALGDLCGPEANADSRRVLMPASCGGSVEAIDTVSPTVDLPIAVTALAVTGSSATESTQQTRISADRAPTVQGVIESSPPLAETAPHAFPATADPFDGPAAPPPIVPHRGPQGRPPQGLRRFVLRGALSYVRLGLEVIRSPDLDWILLHMVCWLGLYLWPYTPPWTARQVNYRRARGFGSCILPCVALPGADSLPTVAVALSPSWPPWLIPVPGPLPTPAPRAPTGAARAHPFPPIPPPATTTVAPLEVSAR